MADATVLLGEALDFMASLPARLNQHVHELSLLGITPDRLQPFSDTAEAILMEQNRLRMAINDTPAEGS